MKRAVLAVLVLMITLGGAIMPAAAETDYTGWFILVVDANKLATANNLARQWDPDPASTVTFTVALSPTGEDPATHYMTSTPATPTMSAGITNALSHLSWAYLYQCDNVLLGDQATWTGPDGFTLTGDVGAAWRAVLVDMGLQRIQPPGP